MPIILNTRDTKVLREIKFKVHNVSPLAGQKIILHPFEELEPTYDAIVIGAGPAGLAGAIYLSRGNLKTMILEAEKPGGRLNSAELIQNYPGFPSITGNELAERMIKQAEAAGSKILCPARAIRFELLSEPKLVWTRDKEYRTEAVLIAIGVQRRQLQIPGARELLGMGVSYCPICDGTLFKGKDVALIGEDEETIADGLYLLELVNKIHFIPTSLTPHYKQESLEKLLSKGNVQIWPKHETTAIVGKPVVEKIRVRALDTKEESELEVKGVFISGEKTPVTQMLSNAGVKTDTLGCIMVDDQMRTNIQGVYAAGDATCGRKYQIAISVGQGVAAALSIIKKHVETSRKKLL